MDWNGFRAAVPATEQVIYLNTGWSGPLCTPARNAIIEVVDRQHQYGPTSPPVREADDATLLQARAAIARLVGAPPECIALTHSAAHALNLVFTGLQFTMGEDIVTTDAEHPALAIPAYYARRRLGLGLKIVAVDHNMTAEEIVREFERLISRQTRLVAISQVCFNVGLHLPVRRIADIAHAHDALVLVDGAQAAGQMPVNVRQLGADFYAISGHKWLLGPTGVGALYIRPDLIDKVEAVMVGRSATRSFDPRGHMEPRRDSVEKFHLTSTSAPLWAGLTAAIGLVESMGLTAVEARVKELSARLTLGLAQIEGVRVMAPRPGPLASGLVPFAIEGLAPADVTEALWQGGTIVARTVPGRPATRLSVHAFNTPEEIDRVVAFVAAIVDRVRHPIRWSWEQRTDPKGAAHDR